MQQLNYVSENDEKVEKKFVNRRVMKLKNRVSEVRL
jgi:hypothetical protein